MLNLAMGVKIVSNVAKAGARLLFGTKGSKDLPSQAPPPEEATAEAHAGISLVC